MVGQATLPYQTTLTYSFMSQNLNGNPLGIISNGNIPNSSLMASEATELEFGIENRSFKSFRHAAEENNWARFYGGIHFHHSCLISTEYGKMVGELVNNRLKMKKKGCY